MLSSAAGLLTDQSFLSVFCAAMLTIGIGWGLRKKNILKAESRPILNALLLKLTVPCLAFDAFMTDFAVRRGQDPPGGQPPADRLRHLPLLEDHGQGAERADDRAVAAYFY